MGIPGFHKNPMGTGNIATPQPSPAPSVCLSSSGLSRGETRVRWCVALSHAVLVSLPVRLQYTPTTRSCFAAGELTLPAAGSSRPDLQLA